MKIYINQQTQDSINDLDFDRILFLDLIKSYKNKLDSSNFTFTQKELIKERLNTLINYDNSVFNCLENLISEIKIANNLTAQANEKYRKLKRFAAASGVDVSCIEWIKNSDF
jgi:hypothetical protein